MPYTSITQLPDYVRRLPEKQQRRWLAVFNSVYDSMKEKGYDAEECEQRAFAAANGVVLKKSTSVIDRILDTVFGIDESPLLPIHKDRFYQLNDLKTVDDSRAYITTDDGKCKFQIADMIDGELRAVPSAIFRAAQTIYKNQITELYPIVSKYYTEIAKVCGEATPPWEARFVPFTVKPKVSVDKDSKMQFDHNVVAKGYKRGLVYGIVYEPYTLDAHDHFTTPDEIEQAAHRFLPHAMMNKNHADDVQGVEVVESYIAPVDFELNGEMVRKGSWVMVVKVHDEELKREIESGEITGFSLEGTAVLVDIAT